MCQWQLNIGPDTQLLVLLKLLVFLVVTIASILRVTANHFLFCIL